MLGLQRRQAEEAAGSVDLQAAMPLKFPRAVYPLAALTLLASSLVVLRYALTNSLDLRAPITEALFQDQLARRDVKKPQPPADTKSFKALKAAEALMAKLNMPTSPDQQQDPDALDKAIDQALAPPSAKSDKSEKSANAGKTGEQQNANGTEPGQNGDPLNGQQANSANQDAKSQQSGQQGNQNEKAQSSNGAESSSSLISKLKDAVSNMLSRNRQDGANDRQSGNPSQQMSQGKPDRANGQKNAGGRGQENAQAQADAQEGDPNGDAQDGQQGQGKNAAKSLSQASAQAGSGIGSQNGEKDVRAAAQLKAMGKISEIIGKRAATISGETMIEVQSGNQTLRTAYNERSATHGEADSDVSRDEIPPALQTYVANYFEQIRRSETAAAPHRSGDGEPARKR
jgi:hypothetical protein